MNPERPYDLAVIGGGSGGFGAALAAARRGLRVLLAEAGPMLGGNSTQGGVNTWEPGIGGPGFHGELFERLRRIPDAVALSRTVKRYTPDQPWGLSRPQSGLSYRDSLRRSGRGEDEWVRVTFEPTAMAAEMAAMLQETGCVTLRLNTRFAEARTDRRRVVSVVLDSRGRGEAVDVRCVVDATAQLFVASELGCATYLGGEPRSLYDEPSAPQAHAETLNGVSLCFCVSPTGTPGVEPLPPGVPEEPFLRPIAITEYPNGDLNLNPLPVMEGIEWQRSDPVEARRECERRVYRLWRVLQRDYGFDRYRLLRLFPMTGVREGPRLLARTVLTENDVRAGYTGGDSIITLADHALDVHGEGHLCRELAEPYGVPYGCLLPREWDNLAVACRGAGFTHIAAASCRLSRTMMQLGHAAGIAAAIATRNDARLPDVDPRDIRRSLAEDDVALAPSDSRFPTP